jgi:hypothetical protein
VNVLDENIPRDQADLLRQWGVRFRSNSRELGYQGIDDENAACLHFWREHGSADFWTALAERSGDSAFAGLRAGRTRAAVRTGEPKRRRAALAAAVHIAPDQALSAARVRRTRSLSLSPEPRR